MLISTVPLSQAAEYGSHHWRPVRDVTPSNIFPSNRGVSDTAGQYSTRLARATTKCNTWQEIFFTGFCHPEIAGIIVAVVVGIVVVCWGLCKILCSCRWKPRGTRERGLAGSDTHTDQSSGAV
ncbi:hypothetical protein B0H10DRAFT_1944681 [Mycena sp. CBHHK59/15]|nr:hypothetical protein B0H10DRAFT_1944681 [Mycena sp. CBHHK59/15]